MPATSPAPTPTANPVRFFTPLAIPKSGGPRGNGALLWVDQEALDAGGVTLSRVLDPKDDIGLMLSLPPVKRGSSEPQRTFWNIRLDTGSAGVWVTPPLVKALTTTPRCPGYVFLSQSERTSSWIKVKGDLRQVTRALRIKLTTIPSA
ncbi:MAG: hypothetical protein SFU85_06130 [Candidatus Methylacidiphilales bacterium]|nr:hypothetical protein [Candidatus Methylacidiphilales bacterium]